jgi:flagellar biosynthetic protein FliQ
MTPQLAVHIIGEALMVTCLICAPILVLAFALSIIINLIQIATSMQDPVFSAVPRLAACFCGFVLLIPWMLHRAAVYAISILGDLAQYAR